MTPDSVPDETGTAGIDQLVMRVAGLFVLLSLLLSELHSSNWLWFTAFVGANLLQASFTGFCPMAKILSWLGVKPGIAFGGPPVKRR